MNPTIRIVSDTATPALRELMDQLTPARLAGRVGPKLQRLTMEHLAALGGNVKGYPSTRFYEKFARNVRWLPDERGVAVAILPAVVQGRTVGLGLRVFGGTITPQSVKMLAIPISPVSYGHVPSDFPNLFLLKTIKGAYLCQKGEQISEKCHVIGSTHAVGYKRVQRLVKQADGSMQLTDVRVAVRGGGNVGRRVRADLVFLFKLVASVTQEGNRDVLPSDDEYLATALQAVVPPNPNNK
jgi:hypothetical protein